MTGENCCPWCDAEIEDMWEYNLRDGDCEEYDCPSCNKKIEISLSVSYDYKIKAAGCEKHILELGPDMSYYSGKKFCQFICRLCKNEFYDHDLPPPIGKFDRLKEGSFTLTPEATEMLEKVLAGRAPTLPERGEE